MGGTRCPRRVCPRRCEREGGGSASSPPPGGPRNGALGCLPFYQPGFRRSFSLDGEQRSESKWSEALPWGETLSAPNARSKQPGMTLRSRRIRERPRLALARHVLPARPALGDRTPHPPPLPCAPHFRVAPPAALSGPGACSSCQAARALRPLASHSSEMLPFSLGPAPPAWPSCVFPPCRGPAPPRPAS